MLLRHASSREICTKFCFKSLDIFRSLLLTNYGLDCRDRTNVAPTIDLSCVCVTILCLREVCRSRLDVVNEGLRLALGEYNFLHLVTNLLLRSNFKPLHSAAIMLFLEMSEEVTIMRAVTEKWMALPNVIMTLLSNESYTCKRTAMCTLVCLLNSHIPLKADQLCLPENPWLWDALPQLWRVMLSIDSPPAARFESAECLVLIHIYSCLEANFRSYEGTSPPTKYMPDDETCVFEADLRENRNFLSEKCLVIGHLIGTLLMISTNSNYHPFLSSNKWHINWTSDNKDASVPTKSSLSVKLLEQKECIRVVCHLLDRIFDEDMPIRHCSDHNSSDTTRYSEWTMGMELAHSKVQGFHRCNLLENLVSVSCLLENQLIFYKQSSEEDGLGLVQEIQTSLDNLYGTIEKWISVDGESAWRVSLLLSSTNVQPAPSTELLVLQNENGPLYERNYNLVMLIKSLDMSSRERILKKCDIIGQRSSVRKPIADFRVMLEKAKMLETRRFSSIHMSEFIEDDGSISADTLEGATYNLNAPVGEGYKTLLHLFQNNGYHGLGAHHRNHLRRNTLNNHHRHRFIDTTVDEVSDGDSVDMKPISDTDINRALHAIGRIPQILDRYSHSNGSKSKTNTKRKGISAGSATGGGEMMRRRGAKDQLDRSISQYQRNSSTTQHVASSARYTIERPTMIDFERYTLHEDQLYKELCLEPAIHNHEEKEFGTNAVVASDLHGTFRYLPRQPLSPPSSKSPRMSQSRRVVNSPTSSDKSRAFQKSGQFSPLRAPSPHGGQILSSHTVEALRSLATCDLGLFTLD